MPQVEESLRHLRLLNIGEMLVKERQGPMSCRPLAGLPIGASVGIPVWDGDGDAVGWPAAERSTLAGDTEIAPSPWHAR